MKTPTEATRNTLIFAAFAAAAAVVGFAQTAYDVSVTPPGTTFPFTHNYAPDFYYYLQLMRQGMQGSLRLTSLMTPETFPPQLINPVFPLLGMGAAVTGWGLPVWYLLGRIAGCIGLSGVIYLFMRRVFPRNRMLHVLSLWTVVFGTPWVTVVAGRPVMPVLLAMWSQLDPMVRFSYIPHHLISKVLLVGSLILFAGGRGKAVPVLFSFLVVLTGFASPITLATLAITLALYAGFAVAVRRRSVFADRSRLIMLAAGGAAAVLTALYHRQVQLGVFPWTSYQQWETVQYPLNYVTYAAVFGPQLILFCIGIPFLLGAGPAGWLTVAWALSGWIGVAVSQFLPLSNVRFIEGYQFIPVAAGAAAGIWTLSGRIADTVWRRRAIAAAVVLLTAYSAVGMSASWTTHLTYAATDVTSPMHYIPSSWMRLFSFLEGQPQRRIVAVPMPLSTMIPAMTGQRAIAGHQMMTYDARQREGDLAAIFRFDAAAVRLVSVYRVSYLVTTEAAVPPPGFLRDTGFRPVYIRDGIIVYGRDAL